MSKIPDFTDTERHVVETTLKERFGHAVEVLVADAEIRMYTGDRELTEVPVLFWKERGCQFVIFKVADNRFRNQFFYSVKDQFGTGREEYDDIGDCVLTLLRVQADHESMRDQT
jgi:hypothetical protein